MERRKPRNGNGSTGSAKNLIERQVAAQKNRRVPVDSGGKLGRFTNRFGTWPTPLDKILVGLLIFLVVGLIGGWLTVGHWSSPDFRSLRVWTGYAQEVTDGNIEVVGYPAGYGTVRIPKDSDLNIEEGHLYHWTVLEVDGVDTLIAYEDITNK